MHFERFCVTQNASSPENSRGFESNLLKRSNLQKDRNSQKFLFGLKLGFSLSTTSILSLTGAGSDQNYSELQRLADRRGCFVFVSDV